VEKMFVLLGDIISSRKIDDEISFQKRLESACRIINGKFKEDIRAGFKIIKGIDEIGGVLKSPLKFYRVIDTLFKELYPYKMRMALVYDYIDVALDTGDVSRMDGPSFHRASMMIEEIKKSRIMFNMYVGNELMDSLIEGQVNLLLLFKSQWSQNEHRIIKEYERIRNQRKVAGLLGISQQAVSKVITKSYWKEINLIEGRLEKVIESYWQNLGRGVVRNES